MSTPQQQSIFKCDQQCFIDFQVRMKDVDTEEELEFQFDKWLSRDKEDDSQMCYKAPAVREGQKPMEGKLEDESHVLQSPSYV